MNAIVKAFIAAGLIDSVVTLESRAPSTYIFEAEVEKSKGKKTKPVSELTDPITDAKFVRQATSLAYTGLVGAILRANGQEVALFDREVEDFASTHQPIDRDFSGEKPMSMEDGVRNAAVVYRIAEHYARVEGNEWLMSLNKVTLVKDDVGNVRAERTTDVIVRPFADWLQVEIERSAPDSQWGLNCLYVKQLGWPKFPSVDIDTAKHEFTEWLNAIPWNREELSLTRREKIVEAVADRKWNNLVKAVVSGVKKDIDKAAKDWIIICHSPKAALQSIAMRMSVEFKLLTADRENAAIAAEADELELSNRRMMLDMQRMQIQAGQLALQAKQIEYQTQFKAMQEQMAVTMKALQASAPVAGVPAASGTAKSEDIKPKLNGSGMGPKIPSYQHR